MSGLIDSGYRGEVCAILINLDPKNVFKVKKGDKMGEGGFRSTGK